MNRVFITGIGVNSPIGCTLDEAFQSITNGYKAISTIESFNTSHYPTTYGAEVKEHKQVVKTTSEVDRKGLFIENSMRQLVESNDFLTRYLPQDLMINIGAGIDYFDLESYVNSGDYLHNNWQNHCSRAIDVVKNMAKKYQIEGGDMVNVSACVASTQAIGNSFRILQRNGDKAIVTGGFDSMLSHLHYMGFYKLGALSSFEGEAENACKPFDKKRCGLVIGEGGISLLLETEKNARKEDVLAEIIGYSSSLDAFQVTDPEPNGLMLAKAAREAIAEAGISPDQIDCVHMHETGTIKNAMAESKALELIFGERFKQIPVYSMKGQFGHLIGACGAMEFLGVIYSLVNQKVPPTVNFETPDPEVPLNVVRGEMLDLKINYILKINAAFGGQNTALVIKKRDF